VKISFGALLLGALLGSAYHYQPFSALVGVAVVLVFLAYFAHKEKPKQKEEEMEESLEEDDSIIV
jgi:uncharacterized membrane protein YuzA (DUF378 family)